MHERVRRAGDVKQASDRSIGLTLAAGCGLIGVVGLVVAADSPVAYAWLAVAALLGFLAQVSPRLLAPINRLWLKVGVLLHRIVSPAILGIMFFVVVTPTGLIMRLAGKDPLRLRWEPEKESYWIIRDPPGPAPETMRNQF